MTQEAVLNQDAVVMRLPKEWPMRLRATLAVLAVIGIAASLIVVLKNDLVHKKILEFEDKILDCVGEQHFRLDDVVVFGRDRTTLKEISDALHIKRGDNLLKTDLYALKGRLEELPWVRDVRIRRSFFPNVLKIELSEKKVFALWQLNERFYPLDHDGYVIEADYRPQKPLLLVVGNGAAENILPFLQTVKNVDPSYVSRIKVANYISGRRFNVILDDIKNGITIKFPQENLEDAWKKLVYLDKVKGILKRKLTIIDLRLKDKVTVKLRKTKIKKQRLERDL